MMALVHKLKVNKLSARNVIAVKKGEGWIWLVPRVRTRGGQEIVQSKVISLNSLEKDYEKKRVHGLVKTGSDIRKKEC